MCGRFTLIDDPAGESDEFGGAQFPAEFAARFNIAPTQPVLAIPNDGSNAARFFLWGLIPGWAKDPSIGSRLINARGETLAEKPSFRGPYKYKRCLIPATGFFEWKAAAGSRSKVPYYIRLKERPVFAFAGLWDEWHAADGSTVASCVIVTTGPNPLMATIHNRMPVILDRADYADWLDVRPQKGSSLQRLIRPYPAELMEAYPVSTVVNSPTNDVPECIEPT
jgi:putative SOS response-associated peptidase YedK